ncbi:MAG TPA: dihydrolipoamide acetyltransferase family protein [Candidatus Dormibacteraeota bacterium]|jgi:pyruvate dehydrogenase E2 component (dihydrolipoamide acetyltransferase)
MADQTFNLPDLGEGLTEAQLMSWRVDEGARVEVNEPLCDVETAKAVVVIPSPFAGVIRKLHAKPGESVDVGAPLVTIESAQGPGEQSPDTLVGYGPGRGPESGIRRRPRTSAPAETATSDVRAAPFVRQLAKERGVDLAAVQGTGPGGRITRADVEAATTGPPQAEPVAALQAAAEPGVRRVSVVGLRKAIARQMVRSVSTIPQFTEFAIFDASALVEARARAKAIGRSATPLAYFVRAVAASVRAYPMLNSSWDEKTDEIVIKPEVNLGIAVNTEKGLLVPVLRKADSLDLAGIAQKSARLIEGARAGSLSPADMTGGTITLTNVGASGPVETGTPIINPPECCVVGFGAIKPRAMVVGGEVVARPGAWISISVDHRIVDGAMATEFLTDLVGRLEKIDD